MALVFFKKSLSKKIKFKMFSCLLFCSSLQNDIYIKNELKLMMKL